jgi:hypothetical protein
MKTFLILLCKLSVGPVPANGPGRGNRNRSGGPNEPRGLPIPRQNAGSERRGYDAAWGVGQPGHGVRRSDTVVPAVEGGAWNADLFERPPHRQEGLLNQADDFEFLRGGISYSASSPSALTFFWATSGVSSARTTFGALASRRRSLTSPEVAARAVSPATRFFPASRVPSTSDTVAAAQPSSTIRISYSAEKWPRVA